MKSARFFTLTILLLFTGLIKAQIITYNCNELDPTFSGDINKAKEAITQILNDKRVEVSDSTGKIKYKDCSVFDDRIVFNLKDGSNKTFYFSDIFDINKGIKFQSCIEHDDYETGPDYDFYSDEILNTKNISFVYKLGVSTKLATPHSHTIELLNALSYFQKQFNIKWKTLQHQGKVLQNQQNTRLYDSLLTVFKPLAEQYMALSVKPAIPEELREKIVQANYFGKQKSYEKAIEKYNEVINSDPTVYPGAYFNLAILHEQGGNYDNAIFNMKKYILLSPDSPDARTGQDKIYEWKIIKEEKEAAEER